VAIGLRRGLQVTDAVSRIAIMRMKILVAVAAISALLLTSLYVRRQKQRYVVHTYTIGDGVYVFVATGMNAMAVITDDGVILVDTMAHGWWGRGLEAALREVTDKPVTTLINTNSHPSHSANNFRFAGDGVVAIAHERTRSRLQGRDNFQGANALHLPQTTFRDRLTLMRGKEPIHLYYFGASNTDGDAWVVFPARRIMHIGDVVKKDEMPEIALNSGGSGVAYAQTMARGITTITGVDLVVAGHAREGNPTITWRELGAYQSNANVLLGAVRTAMTSTDSVDAVASIVRADPLFSRYRPDDVNGAVRAIFAELAAPRRSSQLLGGEAWSRSHAWLLAAARYRTTARPETAW
jgi:glyoxylase-like metal-dependent hydrolase (beta-lactamase superfamily II)